nr:discoidin domain-containing protein [Paenibacillus xylanexedens]
MAKIILTPAMTSNRTPTGSVSTNVGGFTPYAAFDRNENTSWVTSNNVVTGIITYDFIVSKQTVTSYSISMGNSNSTQLLRAPKKWTFEGSNDGSTWVILDTQSNQTNWNSNQREFLIISPNAYSKYRLNITENNGQNNLQLNELNLYGIFFYKKVLVKHNELFKNFKDGLWENVSDDSENSFQDYGIDDISAIPESAWSQLAGEVELCYYTDDPNKTEVSFTIETEPFTLAEEWEDKEMKIIEYTDDPNQTESTITIETESFTLYDELGDSVDVLYYTDDPAKTTAELNFTTNYSPLDELEGDFDVVTWTNDAEVIAGNRDMSISYDALPFEQIIVQPTDLILYGDLKKLVASKIVDTRTEGTLRLAVSFDSGLTWKTYRFDKWVTLDIQNTTLFKRKGMSVETLNRIPEQDLTGLTRVAYYLNNSEHYENNYALDQMKMVMDAPRQTLEVQQMALQLLNTTATIDLTFSGNKLQGVLDDADKGKVKYRVLLNGQSYYPADGGFTRLLPSPFKIEINIDERKFLFDKENTLKVEFQDYWGTVEAREFSFVGTYSGLMFMDESGDFLSDTFGGILKQLDYEVIIAGQTTLTKKVKLINQLGYAVDHVYLEMDKRFQTSGVEVQLSRQADPFLPINYLTYGLMEPEDSVDFYVRIATDIHAKPDRSGVFEMKVKADRV